MGQNFAKTGVLLVQYLKRDWKKILFWVFGLSLFAGAYVPVFDEMFAKNEQGLAGMYQTMQNPAMISMVGPTPVTDVKDYTLGAMYANEMLLFTALIAGVISILHVVSHTRKAEDEGLLELVRSFQVGRMSNSAAVILETILINLLIVGVTTGIMVSFGVDTIDFQGSLLYGLSIGLTGILFAASALFFAQIFPTSAGATGASLGFLGLLYIIRAGTDVSAPDFSWFNPMGWSYLTFPFTENNWLPILLLVLIFTIGITCAFFLEAKRDLGAGFLPQKAGRAYAKKSLLSVYGLFTKLNKTLLIAWLITFAIMGATYGSIYQDMGAFIESNEMMQQMFTASGFSIEESFTSTIALVLASLVAILPIAIINKLYQEEKHGRLSQVFSTKVSRGKLYFAVIGIAVVAAVLGLNFATIGLGGTVQSVMDDPMPMSEFFSIFFNFFPSVLFYIGLAALAIGFTPQFGKWVYVYLGFGFFLNYIGGALDLPEWFEKTAVVSWVPRLPIEEMNWTIFVTITLISIVLIVLGYIGYRNRDLKEA